MFGIKNEESFFETAIGQNINYNCCLEDAKRWMASNLNPEDIFSTTQLDKWAESEGYTKEDNKQD